MLRMGRNKMKRFTAVLLVLCYYLSFITFYKVSADSSVQQLIDEINEELEDVFYYEFIPGTDVRVNEAYLRGNFKVDTLKEKCLLVYGDNTDASNAASSLGMSPAHKGNEWRALGYMVGGIPFPNPNFPSDYEGGSFGGHIFTVKELVDGASRNTIDAWLRNPNEDRYDYREYLRDKTLTPDDFYLLNEGLKQKAESGEVNLYDIAYILQPPTENSWGLAIFFHDLPGVGSGTLYSTAFMLPYSLHAFPNDLGAIVENSISSASPGEAVDLSFLITSTFPDSIETSYTITHVWGTESDMINNNIMVATAESRVQTYSFIMPDSEVKVRFVVNPDNDKPENEENHDNNIVEMTIIPSIPVTITGDFVLDYNVLTQEERFPLGATTAKLTLPNLQSATWTGPATGTLTVTNQTPHLYHDFKVDGASGTIDNKATISINQSTETITLNPNIEMKLIRDLDNYLDDPLNREYGTKDIQNRISPARTGVIKASGSVSRPYSYQVYIRGKTGGRWVTRYGTAIASFSSISNEMSIVVKVYNGKTPVHGASLKEQIDDNITTSRSKHLWWESDEIPLTVLRPMGDKKTSFAERTPPPVIGQYERIFTNQNDAEIKCSISLKFGTEYKSDRDKARARNYSINSADKAVFASDLAYKAVDYPIRSGYFFNPTGTYTFSVTTNMYKNSSGKTEEHAQLVDTIIAAFRYESNMVYIDSSKKAVTIGGISANKTGTAYSAAAGYATVASSPLFEISAEKDIKPFKAEELKHAYSESGTDARFKRVMEGYNESGTLDSKNSYKYVEYVQKDESVYKITETTNVTITVNPDNVKVYTHPQMRNGDYFVNAYFANVKLNSDSLSSLDYSSYLTGQTLNGIRELDKINIKVVGSMYDDVR